MYSIQSYKVDYRETSYITIIFLFLAAIVFFFMGLGAGQDSFLFLIVFFFISGLSMFMCYKRIKNINILKEGFTLDPTNDKFIFPDEKKSCMEEIKISSIYSIYSQNQMEKAESPLNKDNVMVYILNIYSYEREKFLSFKFYSVQNRDHLYGLISKFANLS